MTRASGIYQEFKTEISKRMLGGANQLEGTDSAVGPVCGIMVHGEKIKRSAYEAGFISDTELRKINRGELTGTKNKKRSFLS